MKKFYLAMNLILFCIRSLIYLCTIFTLNCLYFIFTLLREVSMRLIKRGSSTDKVYIFFRKLTYFIDDVKESKNYDELERIKLFERYIMNWNNLT